ncbi:MAG: DNA primase catalytic subunit PriS [Candidatus Thermoplasmatota archaeon]|jgi:DNA primase small subunit|nr:DNA primase catalytic subunit PriS [Candidatus Thermoplasmatota archaeon]MCL5963322.1 DNA primase catalytic subunit PriS [Candidatus Thermoplasmatota archaeon]
MDDKTEKFITNLFKQYYDGLDLSNEHYLDIKEREFAFTYLNRDGMDRPRYFDNCDELHRYIMDKLPAAIFYSTAHYRIDKVYEQKEWMKADLIFDLDADHLPGAESMSYAEMLDRIKIEFYDLVKGILIDDFRVDEKNILITFSGNRGYHAHIHSDAFQNLDARSRRSITTYLGLSKITVEQYNRIGNNGMKKRIDSVLKRLYEDIGNGKTVYNLEPEIIKKLQEKIKLIEKKNRSKARGSNGYELLKELLNSMKIPDVDQMAILNTLIKNSMDLSVIHIDAPVTGDIKRLIRMPLSLHPKSGFVVKKMDLNSFEKFTPTKDAIHKGFTGSSISARVLENTTYTLNDKVFDLKKGALIELPEYAALFFACRNYISIA